MIEFPLNEILLRGQTEDVEWSKRVSQKFNFSLNTYSIVRLLKHKDVILCPLNEEQILRLQKII